MVVGLTIQNFPWLFSPTDVRNGRVASLGQWNESPGDS